MLKKKSKEPDKEYKSALLLFLTRHTISSNSYIN